MADGRLTAGALAALVGGELVGDSETPVAGVASLDEAGPGDVSFLASGGYLPLLQTTRAGAVVLPPRFRDAPGGPAARIIVGDPRAAVAQILRALTPEPPPVWGVHPTARIGAGTRWDGRIAVAAGAVLGNGVRLGRDCRIGTGAVVGDRTVMGDACRIGDHAVVAPETQLGHRVVLKPGARVGQEGFAWTGEGAQRQRVPHRGACRLDDDVEIGANATVDRGSLGRTVVGAGTKLDNLVHVAHNVRIGARCLILAQVGIAGTTTVGDDVMIGGQAGLAGQLRVGDRARLAAQSGVIGDVPPGATVGGYPARDHRAVLRQTAALARLAPLASTLERLVNRHADSD
jgi:UDP-3-O-[3-hydroxymyristoyl] glucosamine N-acyltransferase